MKMNDKLITSKMNRKIDKEIASVIKSNLETGDRKRVSLFNDFTGNNYLSHMEMKKIYKRVNTFKTDMLLDQNLPDSQLQIEELDSS